MNRYVIYSVLSGKILRIVSCPASVALDQLGAGEALLPDTSGTISDSTHCVVGNQFIQLPPPPPPPGPTPEQIRAMLTGLAQRHLDSFARSWGYDDIRSAVTYVGDPYARFNAEGLALRNWRSAVWAWLDAAQSQPLPDPIPTQAEFIALLPQAPSRPLA